MKLSEREIYMLRVRIKEEKGITKNNNFQTLKTGCHLFFKITIIFVYVPILKRKEVIFDIASRGSEY